MRADVWHGRADLRVDTVPEPGIEEPTSTAICGADLRRYRDLIPGTKEGAVKVVLDPAVG